ncbi:T9SS type B sorting domain-containing protein [Flavobacterium sp. PL12]|uniref:T9SS type B sorting domain-containing protein n=1 Tax=Flavobacterium sp. PL12 TaxID=3071718 RepID=UPI00319EAA26
MKIKLLLLFAFLSISCFAQLSKTHYIPPLTCADDLAGDQYIYISTPSATDVNFKINIIGGLIIAGKVSKSRPEMYKIGDGENTQLMTSKYNIGKLNNKGYIIEADDLIYVSVRLNSGFNINRLGEISYVHAGGLVSKGNSALGKTFRLGAMLNTASDSSLLNFASILSTEKGTKIKISNIPLGTTLTNGIVVDGAIDIFLDKNESYVIAIDNSRNLLSSNSSNIIGALIESDNQIVVNSGSFAGTNSNILNNSGTAIGRDVGFDQIVPFEKTGKEYIFIKGIGTNELERVLLIAHKTNTSIFVNGNSNPAITLNAGEFIALDGSQYINDYLYITSSENIFAYQSIGGLATGTLPNGNPNNPPANQNLFFVPPINCATPNAVNNIPWIEQIGNVSYNGGLNIVTKSGAKVLINDLPITSNPKVISVNPAYVYYTVNKLSGNISVKSTSEVYVSYFGTNGAATYGGYYSGFDTKPEIISEKIAVTNSSCIPNVILKINTLSSYDTFEWYKNDQVIVGEILSSYTPQEPGYYQVKGSISGCPSSVPIFSDKIAVSYCPPDRDNDGANDNIDIDNDNDGITNCTESNGDQPIDISNLGTIRTLGSSSTVINPLTRNLDGSFISEVPAGKDNSVTYDVTFATPLSVALEYVTSANSADLMTSDSELILKSPIDKTITVLNPGNQLLIDTNYDGIYESGIEEYSSFEIRFRLNSTTPLAAGTGTFSFRSYLTDSLTFIQKNLSEDFNSKATFKIIATCVPRDSDGDGIPDALDFDSDNDGIPDIIEAQGRNPSTLSGIDSNKNGLDNAFEPIRIPRDTDGDGIPDYLDLDSDNDGIFDIVESGSGAIDANFDGVIDGSPNSFGTNGLADALETFDDSAVLRNSIADLDSDGTYNYIDLDSDGDLCYDVVEAGFLDPDGDGLLGSVVPPTVNMLGLVVSRINGYSTPDSNYLTRIEITTQPNVTPKCEMENASISVGDTGSNTHEWQVSIDGNTWNKINDANPYSGATTNILSISTVSYAMNGFKYRVKLNNSGNSCSLFSDETTLIVYPKPIVNTITIVQCDDDTDGITDFNLTVKDNFVSANSQNETFTFFTTSIAATSADPNFKITNPTSFSSGDGIVWARVENLNGCFTVAQLNLKVSVTQIPATFSRTFFACDDYIDNVNDDQDGVATFDLSSVTVDIKNILPSGNYTINYYENERDALSQLNSITNISNYRNINSNNQPNSQQIWVRVDSTLDNACFGVGPYVTLTVNPKPNIDTNDNKTKSEIVCANLPAFFVTLNAGINDRTSTSAYTYIWAKDGVVLSDTTQTINVNTEGIYTVEVSSLASCSRIRTIEVSSSDLATITNIDILDLAEVNTITVNSTGPGKYEYTLDDPFGSYQSSNIFDNIAAGIHELFIRDINGCGIVSKTISVIGVPKYFTPNNDGFNDYWNVKGINLAFNSNSTIYIFDRYGKLLKQLNPLSQGWDGTFNGIHLPSDDYWYTLKLEDGRQAKGHFSLKR